MNHTALHTVLKERGHRMTKARSVLLHLLFSATRPLSVPELREQLGALGLSPNKTTIYRELDFLKKQNLIRELSIQRGIKCYEVQSEHHHHVICRQCGRVEEVSSGELESLMPAVEKKLTEQTRFRRIDHSLEFYGVCFTCT